MTDGDAADRHPLAGPARYRQAGFGFGLLAAVLTEVLA
jgi:hypothetical protein